MTLAMILALSFALLRADSEIARLAFEMLNRAGSTDDVEHAAFIVRSPAGALSLLHWPRGRFHAATWSGPIPANAIGVIHTHPRSRPMPSVQDRAEARRLRLPFYVVSRTALCVVDASGVTRCAARTPWLARNGMKGDVALRWEERAA